MIEGGPTSMAIENLNESQKVRSYSQFSNITGISRKAANKRLYESKIMMVSVTTTIIILLIPIMRIRNEEKLEGLPSEERKQIMPLINIPFWLL
jgi:hypothetical protein